LARVNTGISFEALNRSIEEIGLGAGNAGDNPLLRSAEQRTNDENMADVSNFRFISLFS
jgi:hypothetical protein